MKNLLYMLFMFFITNVLLFGQDNDVWTSFRAEDKISGLIGYKDKNGIIKIEPKFIRVAEKFNNIIAVAEEVNGEIIYYYLTKLGKVVGRDSFYFYDNLYDRECEGFIRFENHKIKKIGMFNRDGNVAIPAEYDWLGKVKNGMILAFKTTKNNKKEHWKYMLIDTLNNVLIENFHVGHRSVDFFSIEKTKIPNPDTIRESFLANDGSYYSFIDAEKEFKQWLTKDLFLDLTAEKLINASYDTIFWPLIGGGLGISNAQQFINDNFDILKKELLEVLNPDCNNCFMGKGLYDMVVPEKYRNNCNYPIAMVVVPRIEKEVPPFKIEYYSFLRTDSGYKLILVDIKIKGIKY